MFIADESAFPSYNFTVPRSIEKGVLTEMNCRAFWDNFLGMSKIPVCGRVVRLARYQLYFYDYELMCECCDNRGLNDKKLYHIRERPAHPEVVLGFRAQWGRRWELKLEQLMFPQNFLNENFREIRSSSDRFIPLFIPQKIEEYRLMYEKIVAADNEDDAWFEALKEAKDHQFLCDNVEYRLGKKLDNKPLWKLYLGYLKKDGHVQPLLHAYSKYCRVFKNDKGAYDEYQQLAQANPGFSVPWATPFAFETYDPDFFGCFNKVGQQSDANERCFCRDIELFEDEFIGCEKCDYDIAQGWMPFPRSNGMHISFQEFADSAIQQVFSLPAPTIKYIRENAPAEVLQKLYESCKIFYVRSPKTLCYKMEVVKDVGHKWYGSDVPDGRDKCGIYGNSMEIEDTKLEKLKHVYVSKRFSFKYASNRHLCTLLASMDSFTAEDISIKIGSITKKHIHLLLKHGLVGYFHLQVVKMEDPPGFAEYWFDEHEVPDAPFTTPDFTVDDLLPYLPNAESIRLQGIQCTTKTSKLLTEMKFKNKIKVFELLGLDSTELEPVDLAKFLVENCERGAHVFWTFEPHVDRGIVADFRDVVCNHLFGKFVGNSQTNCFLGLAT